MKTLAATIGCAVCEWGLTTTWADTAFDAATAAQDIQQASDPSAAVSAYASGFAADRTNVVLHNAYVTRMVDFGLPELAYHQAQLLTSLDAHNGLAWGVVAHVNARQTDMPGAISAITLAAQSAPEHPFVQRTAGEVLAWYDAKGAQAYMSEDCRTGIAKTRALMTNRPAFTDAYNAARRAYAEQTNAAKPSENSQPTPHRMPVPLPRRRLMTLRTFTATGVRTGLITGRGIGGGRAADSSVATSLHAIECWRSIVFNTIISTPPGASTEPGSITRPAGPSSSAAGRDPARSSRLHPERHLPAISPAPRLPARSM